MPSESEQQEPEGSEWVKFECWVLVPVGANHQEIHDKIRPAVLGSTDEIWGIQKTTMYAAEAEEQT